MLRASLKAGSNQNWSRIPIRPLPCSANEARLAIKMHKAGLVAKGVPLLAGIAIRYPHCAPMPAHRITHDLGCAAELGLNNGLIRAEHPLIAIAPLDPHTRLIASYHVGPPQRSQGIIASGGEHRRGAAALQPAVAFDLWPDLAKINLVIFADHRPRCILRKRQTTMATMRRAVIFYHIRQCGQATRMALVANLRPARTRTIPLRFPIRRGRLRRCSRRLVRTLRPKQKLNQLRLCKSFKVRTFHRQDDSQPDAFGKGVGNYAAEMQIQPQPRQFLIAAEKSGTTILRHVSD